ncbi:stalk domain-containing protein [Gorillibacterium sp. sgz5001074]|uniref:stalk domain-containing protein n=1 Tax=Gorillibacterium sp. sgz5001074 TaxID=3446695 RepID=UPI003F66C64C
MNIKRWGVLTLVLCLVAGGAAVADSRWGNFEGYSKVRVNVNGSTMSTDGVPAFMVKGSTVLPLRQVADAFHAIVKWDEGSQTANIFKPNVNMFVAQEASSSNIKKPFGKVDKGSSRSFDVFVQVDNLLTGASGFKLSVLDPYGSEVASSDNTMDGAQDNFWFIAPFKVKFSEGGNYTVRFAFDVDGSYVTVAEKLIVSE